MRLLYEHVIYAESTDFTCRIWRESPRISVTSNDDLKRQALLHISNKSFVYGEAGFYAICNLLIVVDGVNAVEVKEKSTGDALCVYKDWP